MCIKTYVLVYTHLDFAAERMCHTNRWQFVSIKDLGNLTPCAAQSILFGI